MNPQFPVYVVSKGRWKVRLTADALEDMKVPYYLIVEPNELEDYARYVSRDKLLVTPEKYHTEYDRFWKDDDLRTGPGASRNFAWDHSISNGFAWHWVMDDNIDGFCRLNHNQKIRVMTGTIFRCMEDFCLRYKNVAIAGPNYDFFAKAKQLIPAFITNTRIYSCLLIRNDIPYRWRGRYNEDTDLCLRALKDNWCTVQFNAFLQYKATTQTLKGGNTEQFYSKEGTYYKSKMLVDMHPDVATLVWKFQRCHHHVDYSRFQKIKLILKDNLNIPDAINEYDFKLMEVDKYGTQTKT